MTSMTLQDQIAQVRALMAARLRIRGRTLDHQVRKAGRLLPRAVRRDATYLAQAASVMDHPRLAMMVDMGKAQQAYVRVTDYLETIDPKDRAKGKLLGVLGYISFVVIAVFIVTVWVLVKRGVV